MTMPWQSNWTCAISKAVRYTRFEQAQRIPFLLQVRAFLEYWLVRWPLHFLSESGILTCPKQISLSLSLSFAVKCDPIVAGNTCIVVNGETAVLLDESSDATFVRNKVYVGIAHGLGNTSFLNGFTNSVVSAALISEGHASLVENSDPYQERMDNNSEASYRSGVTTTVAVAAASVTIVVASIFCYGFMRRPKSHDPSVRHRNRSLRKPSPRTVVSGSQLGVPTRRHFVRLEDLSTSPTSFVTASISPLSYPKSYNEEDAKEYSEEEYYPEVDCNPNINWSVSDITSDSASLRSGVSRTPSMLERIDEEIEDEEEDAAEGDDGGSCNFSYSEDSTIITKALSKATIVSYENDKDFDCADESRDRLLNISDLDPCFTILPDNAEELFRDLEDLSSEGTQDSPLESIILEMRMSTEASDNDSFKTAVSNATMISFVSLEDSEDLDLMREDCRDASLKHLDGEQSESSSLNHTLSTPKDDSVSMDSNLISQPEKKEKSTSLSTAIDETATPSTQSSEQTKVGQNPILKSLISKSIVPEADEVDSLTSNDNSYPAAGSGEELYLSEDGSEMGDCGSSSDDLSSGSYQSHDSMADSKAKPPSTPLECSKSFDHDTEVKRNTHDELEKIDSISNTSCSIEGDHHHTEESMDSTTSDRMIDDEANAPNICSVDSIDEWVAELMNQTPKAKSETSVAKT